MPSKSSEKWFFPVESGVMGGAAGKGGKKTRCCGVRGKGRMCPGVEQEMPGRGGKAAAGRRNLPGFRGYGVMGGI